jgi:hypothetical protein
MNSPRPERREFIALRGHLLDLRSYLVSSQGWLTNYAHAYRHGLISSAPAESLRVQLHVLVALNHHDRVVMTELLVPRIARGCRDGRYRGQEISYRKKPASRQDDRHSVSAGGDSLHFV